MKKEKDMVIQVPIRHTEVKSVFQGGALLPGHRWGIFKWPSGTGQADFTVFVVAILIHVDHRDVHQ